jgi:hypothetical protein
VSDQERNYWIIVGSPENFATTRAHGFTVQGLKSRHRKKAEQMRPGDRIVYYITGLKAFGGFATITSEYFEDHSIIWKSTNANRGDETYPFRVQIQPDVILPEGDYLPAEGVALQMRHVQKWPAANWTLAFQGNVHKIDEADFELLSEAIEEAAKVSA